MTLNVVFVAPFPTDITMRFVRAAARLKGVRLLGLVHTPPSGEDAKVYDDCVRVTEPLSVNDIIEGCEVLRRRHGRIDRIIGMLEALMVQLGQAREHFGLPGTSAEVAELFRDKAKMKAALHKAGLPVARNALVTTEKQALAFAEKVGYPLILKPPAGMGARSTFRIQRRDDLLTTLRGVGTGAGKPALLEEFLSGREFSFETITIDGQPRIHSISQYLPPCLHALENPWIKWCCLLPRDISGKGYDDIREIGFAVIQALGLRDGMTHMEWFRREDGSIAIGEIAQRPAGANISTMTGLAHDADIYRAWCEAVIFGSFSGPWTRKFAVGSAFLRGVGHGRVAALSGIAATQQALGRYVVEAKLPDIGQRKADGYEGEGYVIVRDPSTQTVQRCLKKIIETVNVAYSE
jgi:biotin carboxylase